jgi:hypothetical protein
MGDGIFVTSNKWENMIFNENLNYIDNIDGINIYSFTTLDSLKEYAQVNNINKYSNHQQEQQENGQQKNDDLNKNNYFTKLRSSLKKEKNLDQQKDFNNTSKKLQKIIKEEKLDNNNPIEINNKSSSYSLIWQPKVNETLTYDYDDTSRSTSSDSVGVKSKCGKDHCNFGCICDTISNTSTITRDHCGRYECMFVCNCNNRKKMHRKDATTTDDTNGSCSNDDKIPSKNKARRSKRQKYLSLKAFEHYNNDSVNKVPIKRNNLKEVFRNFIIFLNI